MDAADAFLLWMIVVPVVVGVLGAAVLMLKDR